MRLIDADAVRDALYDADAITMNGVAIINQFPTVDAVVLPYHPRPLLKDRNPFGTDVYCPECGTNLSGYYGDEPLPIVTCFNCGEILDPYKATTKMDGRSEDNA